MDEGDGKQGISREGPLRSITSPPFAGPVAFRNSGPLASSRDHIPPASSNQHPAASPDQPQPPTHPPGYASQHHHHYQLQQQPPQQPPLQSNMFADGLVPGAGQYTHPPPPPAAAASPSGTDPLSHLLGGGVQMGGGGASPSRVNSQDPFPPANAGFGYGNLPAARTQAPPLSAEPTPWDAAASAAGGGRVGGGDGDGFHEGASAAPSTQPMPALPPPPTHYPASTNYAASGKHYQQQHLQRPVPPPVSGGAYPPPLPPPPAPAPAAFFPPITPPQEKSLDDLVSEFLSSSVPPFPEPADQDLAMGDPDGWVAALGRLARRRVWGTLVHVAGTMLVAHRGGGAPGLTAEQAMNLRLHRALGMLRLGRAPEAAEAAVEAGTEGGQPPLAAVSVAARLAAAEAKAQCGVAADDEALEELTALKFELEGIINDTAAPTPPAEDEEGAILTPAGATIWRRRIMSSLANAFVRRGSWRLALGLLEAMGEEQCVHGGVQIGDARGASENHPTGEGQVVEGAVVASTGIVGEKAADVYRVEVLSRIGRVFLQFGALRDAEVYFRRAEEAAGVPADNPRILVNRGLLFFSKNAFVEAQGSFEKAATLAAAAAQEEPPDDNDDGWPWATVDEGAGLVESALNNLSLAMVYSCDVIRGVTTLEGLIRKDPLLYMVDVVVFNLCTLYDLSFDAVASARKKRMLQAVAKRFRLEDIDTTSFRMN